MIAAWMLSAVIVALLVALSAMLVEPVVRGLGRPTRWIWLSAMGIALVLPVLQAHAPASRALAAVPNSGASHARRSETPSKVNGPWTMDDGPTPVLTALARPLTIPEQARESIARIDVAPLIPWDRWLVRLWIGMSALGLAYLAFAFAGARRLRRRLTRAEIDGHPVLLSVDCGPAAVGILHVDTVIPQWALALAADDRRLILAHEGEHARGRDPAIVFAALVLLALEPWNVGLWLLVARLRFAVEADCDARVLARAEGTADASTYGRLLVRVHTLAPASASLRLTFVGTKSKLERRVRLLMQRGRGLPRAWASGAVCVALALLICAWAVPSPAVRRGAAPDTSNATVVTSRAATGLQTAKVTLSTAVAETRALVTGHLPPLYTTDVAPSPALGIIAPSAALPRPIQPDATPCDGSSRPDVPLFAALNELAREHYGDRLRTSSPTTIAVVGFLLEPGTCRLVRDTIDWIPRTSSYNGNEIAAQLFHISNPISLGLSRTNLDSLPEFVVSFVMPPAPSQPGAPGTICGIGTRSNETCTVDGTVVIRRVDSVRALIAIVGDGPPTTSHRRLFMYTSSEPLSPLLSRTIDYAHVEYTNGMVYIVSRSGSDPTMLFQVGKPAYPGRPRAAETFDQGLGLSMYSIQGFTADQIRRLEPAACSTGERISKVDAITGEAVPPASACYAVDNRVIRFPL